MKKVFSILYAILLSVTMAIPFSSCIKELEGDPSETSTLKFDIQVINESAPGTKAVKTDWEVGDKIFVFFNVAVQPASVYSYGTGYLDPANGYVTITYDGSKWNGTAYNFGSGNTAEANYHRLGTSGTMYAVYFPFGNMTRESSGFKGSGHTNASFNGNPVYSFYLIDETGSPYTMTHGEMATLSGTLHMTLPENFVYFYIDQQGDDFAQNEKYRLSVEGVKPATVLSWETDGSIYQFAKDELGAGKPMWGYKYGDGIAFTGIIDDSWSSEADHKLILFSDGDPAITKTLTNVTLDSHASVNLKNPKDDNNGWTQAMTAPLFTQMGDGGLKWGAWNLGGTGLDDYGTPFSWGEIVSYSGKSDTRYTTHNLTGDYALFDVARAYLGADWRMATEAEIVALSNNTASAPSSGDVSTGHFSRKGLVFTTSSAPQKSILFQTYDEANGYYWTSSYNNNLHRYNISTGTASLLFSTSACSNPGVIRPIYLGTEAEVIIVPGLFGAGEERDDYQGINWPESTLSEEEIASAFKTTDNVYVYNKTTTLLDNVVLHPCANAAEVSYFDGSLGKTYEAGNELLVLYNTNNSGVVDYTTQDGSLEKVIDAGAVEATVSSVSGQVITTNPAKIENLQSIFRFEFKLNGTTTISNIRFVRIFSGGDKLQSTYDVKNDTPTYGPVTISRSTDLADQYIYAGLRFDTTPNDPIVFQLFDKDGKAYSGSLNAPADGFVLGKYYIATVAVHLDTFTVDGSGTKVCFSPGDYNGSSFSEPFAGIGVASCYFNKSDAITNKTVGGVSWRIPGDGASNGDMAYILNSRNNMQSGVSRSYRVYINKSITIGSLTTDPVCCLLIPPDATILSDAEVTELNSAGTSSTPLDDYLKYIGKGFVILTRTGWFNKNNVFQTSYLPNDGFYRLPQTNKFLRFGPSTNLTIGFYTIPTDKGKARVRYIHTITE